MKKKYLLFIFLFGLFILPNKVLAYDDYVELIDFTNGNSYVDLNNPYAEDDDSITFYLSESTVFDFSLRNYNIDDYPDYMIRYNFSWGASTSYVTGNNFTSVIGLDIDSEDNYYADYFFPYFSINFIGDNALKIKVGNKLYDKLIIYLVNPEIFVAMDAYVDSIIKDGLIDVDTIGIYNDTYISYPTLVYGLRKYKTEDYYLDGYCSSADNCILDVEYYSIPGALKRYKVNYDFKEENSKVVEKLNKYLENITTYQESNGVSFAGTDDVILLPMEDLEVISYFYTVKDWVTTDITAANTAVMRFSKILSEILEYSNVDYVYYPIYHEDYDTYQATYGYLPFTYNDVAYTSIFPIGYAFKNIIYIPADTENNRDAFINAAKARIKESFGYDLEIGYEGQIDSLTNTEKDLIDVSKTLGEYYYITIGNYDYSFFIVKDSSKMQENEVHSTDFDTNAKIVVEGQKVSFDSKIVIEELDKESDEYKTLMQKLNLVEGSSYNINLVTSSTNVYIDKINEGKFKVYIPISDDLVGKDLMAYYLNNDGTIEEFEVTIENGYAVFETSHFSVYTIGPKIKEETSEENPPTRDDINKYIVIGEVSMIMLLLLGFNKIKNKRLDS